VKYRLSILLVATVAVFCAGYFDGDNANAATGDPSIRLDVVGDGGSDNSYCGAYEASYGKTVFMVGPVEGATWYTCRHFNGWTNDNFVYWPCSWCSQYTWWRQALSFFGLNNVDLYAWDSW
jgi:hypothetical protein